MRGPLASIAVRLAVAVGIVVVNWPIVLVERGSYTDSYDRSASVVDALYYTTVTLTTTGYGDITPVTTLARLINALVVTPMRLLFVVLLVGTTIKALTQQSRQEFRLARWRKRVNVHTVVLGFGTKGRNAVRELTLKRTPADRVVVVDTRSAPVAAAAQGGHVAVQGSATSEDTLRRALVDRAARVLVALDRDDSAILAVLTVRRLSTAATVVAVAREAHNAEPLRQSGANSVIVSSETTGRLLGLASDSPAMVELVEDLLSFGNGLDLEQRPVTDDEVGRRTSEVAVPLLAVVRSGALLHHDAPEASELRPGDELIVRGPRNLP